MERAAYKDDLPGSRRSPCIGCDLPVVTARDAHVQIGGRRDGSLLIEIDVDPLMCYSSDVDAIYGADGLYLLGVAHRGCRLEARRRLEAGKVELPAELPLLRVDDQVPQLPALHLPPALDRCAFCDGADPTDEHVFPKWLSRELSSVGGLVDFGGPHGPRRLRSIEITAPVCATCNNRWLSVLENDVKPILSPLMHGEPRHLWADDQRLLATWASKTAMMIDLASGTPVIPTGFFHELRQRRRGLDSHFVLISAYGGPSWATWASHAPLRIGIDQSAAPNGFVTTFTVFHVVFQVFGHFTRGGADFNDGRIYRDALAQIWPVWRLPVEWPPSNVAFDDRSLSELAASING